MTASLFSEILAALPADEAISATARLGYPAIELLCAPPHLDHGRARRDAAGVAARIRDAGLAVSVLSLHNSFTEPARLAEQLGNVRDFIALAPAFGTRTLQLDPGRPAAPDAGPEQWQCLARALRELAAMADGAGVRLAFHTTMRQITSTVAGAERLLDLAGADCIGVSADFCNLRINGDAPTRVIDRLGARIYHTHIKNGEVAADGSCCSRAWTAGCWTTPSCCRVCTPPATAATCRSRASGEAPASTRLRRRSAKPAPT